MENDLELPFDCRTVPTIIKKSEIKERECDPMLDEAKTQKERSDDLALLSGLTRRQLKELEEKEKTPAQKTAEAIILLLPLLCGGIALLEYLLVPNNSRNRNPWSYVWVLGAALAVYTICLLAAVIGKRRGKKSFYESLRYRAPR